MRIHSDINHRCVLPRQFFIFKLFIAFVAGNVLNISVVNAESLVIFAPASTTNVIHELAHVYQQEKGVTIHTSFASSGTLARQILNGAPADLFLSASVSWMDDLQKKKILAANTRIDLFSNSLVMIFPNRPSRPIDSLFFEGSAPQINGYWATGDPDYVPVGMYARQALIKMGWWDQLESRLIRAHDVRSALIMVERGEVAMGIVYYSDLLIAPDLVSVPIPAVTHQPVVYPLAIIRQRDNPVTRQFFQFLQTSRAGEIFRKFHFSQVLP
ncbi:MAG: molybdate ABC transporter substrate-binding protein [SAR324 cluster bacterium]|nr:molybdate ABC transporter substrate-binding protein [SAR324 cluster bacterium]